MSARTFGIAILSMLLGLAACAAGTTRPADRALLVGADISLLPDIEKAGGVFRGDDGKPGDALRILRDAGCSVFRVRLFVAPNPDFKATGGAVQDLNYVRALGK